MDTPAKFDLTASLRGTRLDPLRTGTALSLMLLWSQFPTSNLEGLPSFNDASAEFLLKDPTRVARTLAPDIADELVRGLTTHRPSDLEALRRTMMNALDARLSVDDIAETILAFCAPYAWVSDESSAILIAALGARKGERIRCAFSCAMRIAWVLSKSSSVDLDVEDESLVPVLSMLATASGRSLRARVNTIDSVSHQDDRSQAHQQALIFPPLGMRRQPPGGFTGDHLGSEAFGALWGAHAGRGRNIVIVGNGLLFRTSSRDAAFKQDLIHSHGLETVIALPRGTLPGTGVATSALVFAGEKQLKRPRLHIQFIDASDPAALSPSALGRLFNGGEPHPLSANAPFKELADAGFNLSVDRYVLNAEARRNREILEQQETVKLADLADIRRPQALPRDAGKEDTFEVREALLADIENGRLALPGKLSELPRSAATKIENAVLKPGDVLLSIKGTIGKVALVTEEAIAASRPEPIVPGQSFVILRLRKGSLIRDPKVLLSYLRSSVAQSILHGMAGGSTILNVAMGELKNMPVPVLSAEAQGKILKKFDEYSHLLRNIDEVKARLRIVEQELYTIAMSGK